MKKQLPEMKEFDNILTMKKITKDEYKKVQNFYKNMKFKKLKRIFTMLS